MEWTKIDENSLTLYFQALAGYQTKIKALEKVPKVITNQQLYH